LKKKIFLGRRTRGGTSGAIGKRFEHTNAQLMELIDGTSGKGRNLKVGGRRAFRNRKLAESPHFRSKRGRAFTEVKWMGEKRACGGRSWERGKKALASQGKNLRRGVGSILKARQAGKVLWKCSKKR